MALPDFEAWAIFASVVEHGSFNGAARTLGLSTATISKAVGRLEAAMGTTLFNRTSRRLALTGTGAMLAERAARLLADGIETEECAREEVGMLRGTVRLAVPMSFGIAEVGPLIARFLVEHPEIKVDLHLSDALVDLVGEGYDAALRIGALPDSSLRSRTLRPIARRIVGSAVWIARHRLPTHPHDVPPDQWFGYTGVTRQSAIIVSHSNGETVTIQTEGRMRANNSEAMLCAVEAGVGVAVVPDFIVDPWLRPGRVQPMLDGWSPPPIALHLMTPPGRLRPRRVTALMEFLTDALRRPDVEQA